MTKRPVNYYLERFPKAKVVLIKTDGFLRVLLTLYLHDELFIHKAQTV